MHGELVKTQAKATSLKKEQPIKKETRGKKGRKNPKVRRSSCTSRSPEVTYRPAPIEREEDCFKKEEKRVIFDTSMLETS